MFFKQLTICIRNFSGKMGPDLVKTIKETYYVKCNVNRRLRSVSLARCYGDARTHPLDAPASGFIWLGWANEHVGRLQ
jgi:hypothetical protein